MFKMLLVSSSTQTHNRTMGVVVVPPEQLESWTNEDITSFNIWKSNKTTKNSRTDYIVYCNNVNEDFNMERIYDGIEAGLSVLERFVEFMRLFPSFDSKNEIETAYGKENKIEKDFINF